MALDRGRQQDRHADAQLHLREGEFLFRDQQPANLRISVTLHVAPDKVAEMYSRFAGDQQAAISRLITPHTLGQTKRRKHPSMSDAQTQNASAPTPPAVSGQPGSKVNVTA
jgi:hypothetical protein